MTNTLHIMIGVAGSGKSTVVEKLEDRLMEEQLDVVVICPDDLREKFCGGNRADQSKNKQVWAEAYNDVDWGMEHSKEIIFDATMLSPKKRVKLIQMAKKWKYSIMAHVVERDEETIKKQNANRKWVVPEFIIDSMISAYTRPEHKEGFDGIVYH